MERRNRQQIEQKARELAIEGYQGMSNNELGKAIQRAHCEGQARKFEIEGYQQMDKKELRNATKKAKKKARKARRLRAQFESDMEEFNLQDYQQMSIDDIRNIYIREWRDNWQYYRKCALRSVILSHPSLRVYCDQQAQRLNILDYQNRSNETLGSVISQALFQEERERDIPRRSQRLNNYIVYESFWLDERAIEPIVLTSAEAKDPCSICLADISEAVATLCKHIFHKECIEEWAKNSIICPMCRQSMHIKTKLHALSLHQMT
ncbi:uncharacterized protein [Watersipora subatra]|uniref:uncharacterized protein n=1 Tax=Watersipora subatra TaxID=2589382 RepID=UPI00355AE20D